MSYILEALKKSDQQRHRGATPTLPTAQVTFESAKQPRFFYYGLLVAVLLGVAIAIIWLRPWQAVQVAHETNPGAVEPVVQLAQQPVPTIPEIVQQPEIVQNSVIVKKPEIAKKIDQVLQGASVTPVVQPPIPAHAAPIMSTEHLVNRQSSHVEAAREQQVNSLAELPPGIRQELPVMTIQFHAYSSAPANRLVGINSQTFHEGELVIPGLKLEQITSEGVILSYKGYRFQRGIR